MDIVEQMAKGFIEKSQNYIAPSVKQAQSIVGYSKGRPENDFYPTPENMTQSLLDNHRFENNVWECACGDGAMSKVLLRNGYNVYSSDKYDYGFGETGIDFLAKEKLPPEIKTIITNPPFKLAEDFVEKAFKMRVQQLALLCKLSFLEGQKRKIMYEKYRLARVLVFSKRQTMTRNGEIYRNGGMIAFAWFIWDYSYLGRPTISWI